MTAASGSLVVPDDGASSSTALGLPSGPTPRGISDKVRVYKKLGLQVVGNTLSGDVAVGCGSVSAALCSSAISGFQAINQTDGTYTVDLNIYEAGPGEDPDFTIRDGGRSRRGWGGKAFRHSKVILYTQTPGYGNYVATHEFGHILGLRHQENSTLSFMSYDDFRRVIPASDDLKRLVEAYR